MSLKAGYKWHMNASDEHFTVEVLFRVSSFSCSALALLSWPCVRVCPCVCPCWYVCIRVNSTVHYGSLGGVLDIACHYFFFFTITQFLLLFVCFIPTFAMPCYFKKTLSVRSASPEHVCLMCNFSVSLLDGVMRTSMSGWVTIAGF